MPIRLTQTHIILRCSAKFVSKLQRNTFAASFFLAYLAVLEQEGVRFGGMLRGRMAGNRLGNSPHFDFRQ